MFSLSRSSKLQSLTGATILTACAFAAQADEFSWQLSGGTRYAEAGEFDADSWDVDGTYYMNPIDDSSGPYALASFLNPTTRVSATASRNDAQDLVEDPTAYTLSGAYVLPGERWYVGASYAKTDTEDPPPVTRSDNKGYGVLAGRYLGANTTLELGLGRSEGSIEAVVTCPPGSQICVAFPYRSESTTDSIGLDVFHVRRFRSLTYSLQGSVSENDNERLIRQLTPSVFQPQQEFASSRRAYAVAGELFPTNRLGVRIGYSTSDVEGFDDDIDAYNVAATWFFKPRVAIELSLGRVTVSGVPSSSDESESAAIRFIGRL